MSRSIAFVEKLLELATNPADVELFCSTFIRFEKREMTTCSQQVF